jgi:hypothetical protein
MKKILIVALSLVLLVSLLSGCTGINDAVSAAVAAAQGTQDTAVTASEGPGASMDAAGPQVANDAAAVKVPPLKAKNRIPGSTAASDGPDGKGVLNFTVVLHLEGWNDGTSRRSFEDHAKKLREYADLFEKYGAKMTLESKEIIDGCINWGDNVLLEMQQRGHAVGIHADAGGHNGATVQEITRTLDGMQSGLARLGIDARWASGVCSKADWVTASVKAGMQAVTCMVDYGLWSLDPALRPAEFEPYVTPAAGHGPYPADIRDRVSPWIAGDGSDWIIHDPSGSLVIIPPGLSLNNASEETQTGGESTVKSDFTMEDIDAWEQALPEVLAATDSHQVNTFYAVWSFGQALDKGLLEDWLKLIDSYVQKGLIRWTVIPDMVDLYRASL